MTVAGRVPDPRFPVTQTEEELAIATGRFDERRRQEHLSQLAFEMQRRFEEGGYDSDLEREGRKRGKGTPEDEERMKVRASPSAASQVPPTVTVTATHGCL